MIMGKTADAGTLAEVNATTAGTNYANTTQSLQALATNGASVTVAGYATGQDPATLVLDAAASSHNTSGTIGAKINAAGAAADPLANDVPGSYDQGTAGYALGRIGTATITATSPVATGGRLEIIQGDDYLHADGRALVFTGDTADIWPDLTGATVVLATDSTVPIAGTGTVVTPTGTQVVRIEIVSTETAKLEQGTLCNYAVTATLASGHVVTLVTGKCYTAIT